MENSQQQKGRQIRLTALEIKLSRLASDLRLADPKTRPRPLPRNERLHAPPERTRQVGPSKVANSFCSAHCSPRYNWPMASVLYQCPTTGMNVQAWLDDDTPADDRLT